MSSAVSWVFGGVKTRICWRSNHGAFRCLWTADDLFFLRAGIWPLLSRRPRASGSKPLWWVELPQTTHTKRDNTQGPFDSTIGNSAFWFKCVKLQYKDVPQIFYLTIGQSPAHLFHFTCRVLSWEFKNWKIDSTENAKLGAAIGLNKMLKQR